MNVREWLQATNPMAKRLTYDEKARRRDVRARVFQRAGTTYATIINGLHRGRFGLDLLVRLEAATAVEAERISVADQVQLQADQLREAKAA